jgi:TRAP-type mannitol/chloroaromatic compound transport system permease small subunit
VFLGSSIEPEKASLKSASTANPPQNDHFIAFLSKIYRLNGFGMISILIWSLASCFPLPFFGPRVGLFEWKLKQFFCFSFDLVVLLGFAYVINQINVKQLYVIPSKQGTFRH